jgi:hypothetical protein
VISVLELRRIMTEWQTRLKRIQTILQPPEWSETDWKQFGRALVGLLQQHGASWNIESKTYWDLRWHLRDSGQLICQVESIAGQKVSLVVAQMGGWVREVESYTWFWVEFDLQGEFIRDPYWVEGTWKEALTTLLMPYQHQAGYFLAGSAPTPPALLLGHTSSRSEAIQNVSVEHVEEQLSGVAI